MLLDSYHMTGNAISIHPHLQLVYRLCNLLKKNAFLTMPSLKNLFVFIHSFFNVLAL